MHEFAKKIMECVKTKVDGKGIDNINGPDVEELKYWTAIANNIAQYDYYYHIVKAMQESGAEYGKDYDEKGLKYYTNPYIPNDYRMTMDDYKNQDPQRMRDLDRKMGRMYYTEPNRTGNHNMRDGREGRMGESRRRYFESKEKNPNDQNENVKNVEEMMDSLKEDIEEMKPSMSPAEKTMMKQKMTNMVNDIFR